MRDSEQFSVSTIDVLQDWNQIRGEAGDWNQLVEENFMLQSEWLESWWEAYHKPGDRLAVLSWSDRAAERRGLLPGFVTRGKLGRTYRLLGSGAVCSDYVRLLGGEGDREAFSDLVAGCMKSDLFRQGYGRLDAIEWEGHLQGEVSFGRITGELQQAGWSVESRDLAGAWRVKLPGTTEEFVAQLHKSRRRKVNKARRLVAEGQVSYEAVGDWPRIDSLWGDFVRLHQSRRELLGQPGCFVDPRFGEFLRKAVQRFAARRSCWLGVLWAAGQPVGMNLIFLTGGTANMYQSGMDPTRSELDPGHLLNYFSIEMAIERGAQWFDFLRGDEPYKEGWGAERRGLSRTRLFAPHLSARLRQRALAAGRELRAWSAAWLSPSHTAPPAGSTD